jgi:hypothetical protein
LNLKDPCYFCIRFGEETLCYNRYIHFMCNTCFAQSSAPETVYPRTLPYYRQVKSVNAQETIPLERGGKENDSAFPA